MGDSSPLDKVWIGTLGNVTIDPFPAVSLLPPVGMVTVVLTLGLGGFPVSLPAEAPGSDYLSVMFSNLAVEAVL